MSRLITLLRNLNQPPLARQVRAFRDAHRRSVGADPHEHVVAVVLVPVQAVGR
jgi:hypothetical protein